jgi:uncharacterized protein YneF (UPF0154 family)
MSNTSTALSACVRKTQLILSFFVLGLAAYVAVALMFRKLGNPQPPSPSWLLSYAAILLTVLQLLVFAIFWLWVARKQIARTLDPKRPIAEQEHRLLGLYKTQHLLAAAILEGAAFFLLIAYIVEGHAVCIFVAAVLGLVIACLIPSVARAERWLQRIAEPQ